MDSLEATHALYGLADAEVEPVDQSGLKIGQFDTTEKLLIRGDASQGFQKAAGDVLGRTLPTEANTSTGGEITCLYMSPTEWLILSNQKKPLFKKLNTALKGEAANVIDVSSAWAVVELSGEHAEGFLSSGCSLDLHGSQFPEGRCAPTKISNIDVVIRRPAAASAFQILVDRSLAADLWAWLHSASEQISES